LQGLNQQPSSYQTKSRLTPSYFFSDSENAAVTLSALLLLGYGSLYYYDLGLTLMTKSWLLLGSGILLLGARQLLTTFAARSDS